MDDERERERRDELEEERRRMDEERLDEEERRLAMELRMDERTREEAERRRRQEEAEEAERRRKQEEERRIQVEMRRIVAEERELGHENPLAADTPERRAARSRLNDERMMRRMTAALVADGVAAMTLEASRMERDHDDDDRRHRRLPLLGALGRGRDRGERQASFDDDV